MSSKRKVKIEHEEIVARFARRLRQLRVERGMTQAELAARAGVTTTYVSKLEGAGAAPGIDLVARLARALGTTNHDLLPATDPPDTMKLLRDQARVSFDAILAAADREMLLMLNPLLATIAAASERGS
jgi:transcriptional regulator with XRE-family HTH domain